MNLFPSKKTDIPRLKQMAYDLYIRFMKLEPGDDDFQDYIEQIDMYLDKLESLDEMTSWILPYLEHRLHRYDHMKIKVSKPPMRLLSSKEFTIYNN